MVGTVMYGRDDEIEKLSGFVDDIASGVGRTIVIDGPVGIGKTRLLQAATERAAVAGVPTGCAAARPGLRLAFAAAQCRGRRRARAAVRAEELRVHGFDRARPRRSGVAG